MSPGAGSVTGTKPSKRACFVPGAERAAWEVGGFAIGRTNFSRRWERYWCEAFKTSVFLYQVRNDRLEKLEASRLVGAQGEDEDAANAKRETSEDNQVMIPPVQFYFPCSLISTFLVPWRKAGLLESSQ